MTDTFINKNIKLSIEFDEYLAKHPNLFEKIPNGAYIVITINGDNKFNQDSLSTVRDIKHKKVVEAHKTASRWSLRPLELQPA